jgi:hypothetical protein
MTLEECEKIRDEIERKIAPIIETFRKERCLDTAAIKELRDFCRRTYPEMRGRMGNIGSKIAETADYASKTLTSGDVYWLYRGLGGIDAAISTHKDAPGNLSGSKSE